MMPLVLQVSMGGYNRVPSGDTSTSLLAITVKKYLNDVIGYIVSNINLTFWEW